MEFSRMPCQEIFKCMQNGDILCILGSHMYTKTVSPRIYMNLAGVNK